MQLYAPVYYEKFQCIADRCTHSCCVGWEIDVDGQTLALYRAAQGEAREMLCRDLAEDEEGAHFVLRADGRCPHLTENGLCEIISAWGEGYLCDICREHPRFYNAQGDRMECGLGAACEEAARLILGTADYRTLCPVEELDGTDAPWSFSPWTERDALFATLCDTDVSYEERLQRIGEKCGVFLPVWGDMQALLSTLEYLDPTHGTLLSELKEPAAVTEAQSLACERFLAYLLYRHAGGEDTYGGFCAAVGLALAVERTFRALVCGGMDPVRAAVLISEELEYSQENTEAIRHAVANASKK